MDFESPIERLLRPREITRHMLLHLPLLIPLGVVSEITGLSFRDIAQEVRSGKLRTWQGRVGGLKKYFRNDALAIAGLGPSGEDVRACDPCKPGANGSNPCPPGSTNGSRGLTPPPA
jgi:hypothetical protein